MSGEKEPCFDCKHLHPDEKWDGEVYCDALKAYITQIIL